jgi:hypothetical protein
MLLPTGCAAAERAGPTPSPDVADSPDSASPDPAGVAHAARSQVVPEAPRLLALPDGTVMPVDPAHSGADGVLVVPDDINRAGWWTGGSRLGDPFGGIVLAAHVDSLTQGVGPIVDLLSARPGDRVTATGRRLSQRFRIRSVRLVQRASLQEQSAVFSPRGSPRLVLITCAGPYDAARGGYRDNLVVTAVPDGRMRHR